MFGICYYIIGVCKDGCKSGWKGVECLEGILKKRIGVCNYIDIFCNIFVVWVLGLLWEIFFIV